MEREESKIVQTLHTTPDRTKFLVQSVIGIIVILFSATQIALFPDRSNNIWIGLICTILGLFFPHPSPREVILEQDAVANELLGGGEDGGGITIPTQGHSHVVTTHTRSRPSPAAKLRTILQIPRNAETKIN